MAVVEIYPVVRKAIFDDMNIIVTLDRLLNARAK